MTWRDKIDARLAELRKRWDAFTVPQQKVIIIMVLVVLFVSAALMPNMGPKQPTADDINNMYLLQEGAEHLQKHIDEWKRQEQDRKSKE